VWKREKKLTQLANERGGKSGKISRSGTNADADDEQPQFWSISRDNSEISSRGWGGAAQWQEKKGRTDEDMKIYAKN